MAKRTKRQTKAKAPEEKPEEDVKAEEIVETNADAVPETETTESKPEDAAAEEPKEPVEANGVEPVEPGSDLDEDVAKLTKLKRKAPAAKKKNVKRKRVRKTVEKEEPVDATEPTEPVDATAEDVDVVDPTLTAEDAADDDAEALNEIEDEAELKRKQFEEKFAAIFKKPNRKKKKDEVDLEAMQDEAIAHLKNMMKEAAYVDVECVNEKKPATNKLQLLPQVKQTLLKSSLYDSILDNNLLEAVRIWLEPLPDASLPSYEIQKTLLNELTKLPIKTIHLRESGLGKVMVFYQKSPKVDPILKRTAEKLINDWTRPIMGSSDTYRAKNIRRASFNPEKFRAQQRLHSGETAPEKTKRKTLYQESADRRKRAAAPEANTAVYTIAPQVNQGDLQRQSSYAAMGIGSSLSRDERFKKLNQKLTVLSHKKGVKAKKGGVSIEGRGVNTF